MIFPFNKIKLRLRTQWWINKCQLKTFHNSKWLHVLFGEKQWRQSTLGCIILRKDPSFFFLATNSHHPLVLYCTRRFFGGPSRKREKVRRASLTLSNDVINPNKKMLYSSTVRSSSFSSYFPWITNLQKMLYLTTHVIVSRYLKHWDYKCKILFVTCKVFS